MMAVKRFVLSKNTILAASADLDCCSVPREYLTVFCAIEI